MWPTFTQEDHPNTSWLDTGCLHGPTVDTVFSFLSCASHPTAPAYMPVLITLLYGLTALLSALFGFMELRMLVAFWNVTWLPPMSEWMSGIMPYPYLLPSQMLIIVACAKVCLDFSKGRGWFVRTRPAFGRGVLYFGYLYFAGMIVRYGLQMILRPETRWFGGTIPIFFHLVLAGFIILFGLWHRARL